MRDQIFLSYSRTDSAACVLLQSALEQAGLGVFRDQDSIHASDRWVTELQRALETCSGFVVLVGRDGVRRWVGAEVEFALARHFSAHDEAQRLPIFPVLLGDTGPDALPPLLSLHQWTRWSSDQPPPADLVDAVRSRAIRRNETVRFEGCPFLGLQSFQRKDALLFFGRRKETLEALAALGDQGGRNPGGLHDGAGTAYYRWLQIEGNSGAGKSSLVRAGLLPMIERGMLWARTRFERWRILGPMLPSQDPVSRLAEAIEQGLRADAGQRDTQTRWQRLNDDPMALKFALSDFKQPDTAFLLIIDQFEELFTFSERKPREQFDRLLARALQDPDCPLFVVSTVRVDFLEQIDKLPELSAIYNSRCKRYLLPAISEAGLREVIEQPARLVGLDVSEVSAAILEDARDEIGALPLVENALVTLWNDPNRQGGPLRGKFYVEQHGMAGMLSSQADALLERVDAEFRHGKQAALELLLRLTRVGDEGRYTRKRIPLEEAVEVAGNGDEEMGRRIVELLSGGRPRDVPESAHRNALRLITIQLEGRRAKPEANAPPVAEKTYVDLIHETLIRTSDKDAAGKPRPYWPTLYEYVEKNRDRDVYLQQLELQTERWLASGWLGRWWNLAGWRDLKLYRKLRIPKRSPQGRFLFFSRWTAGVQLALLALLIFYVGQSYYWTRKHDLPPDAMMTLQRFRMGYAPVPEMVAIPPGSVDMGERDKKFLADYGPDAMQYLGVPGTHADIGKGFSLGKYEVTYDQFDYYVWAQRRAGHDEVKFPTTAKGGRGTHPVVNVSWKDANAYAEWLGSRTHRSCRLPTEAEWEYAARAGKSTAYWWGDTVGKSNANCRGCGSQWDNDQSAPVGSFRANAFGLYDTSGNVWEWTCSAWRKSFDGSERSCLGKEDPVARVMRGGSWIDDAALARSSARRGFPGGRNDDVGFRVLCSSPIEQPTASAAGR